MGNRGQTMSPLVLTEFGKFANQHSVMTSLGFWRGQLQDIERALEEDADVDVMLEERINGLVELRERMYEFLNADDPGWHVKDANEV